MAETTDAKKLEAFKALYGLAEGAALKRIYRERTGRDADECPDLAAWARAHPEISFKPTKADIETVERLTHAWMREHRP